MYAPCKRRPREDLGILRVMRLSRNGLGVAFQPSLGSNPNPSHVLLGSPSGACLVRLSSTTHLQMWVSLSMSFRISVSFGNQISGINKRGFVLLVLLEWRLKSISNPTKTFLGCQALQAQKVGLVASQTATSDFWQVWSTRRQVKKSWKELRSLQVFSDPPDGH